MADDTIETDTSEFDKFPPYFITPENLVFQKTGFSYNSGPSYSIDVGASKLAEADIRLIEYYYKMDKILLPMSAIECLVSGGCEIIYTSSELYKKPISEEAPTILETAKHESELIRTRLEATPPDTESTSEATPE